MSAESDVNCVPNSNELSRPFQSVGTGRTRSSSWRYRCGESRFGFRLLVCSLLFVLFVDLSCGDGGVDGAPPREGTEENTATVQAVGNQPRPSEHQTFSVESRQDALKYLQKYGYLSCNSMAVTSSNSARRQQSRSNSSRVRGGQREPSSVGQGGQGGARRCTDRTIQAAIKQFQQKFNLEQTGRLDVSTKRMMSRGRCGNTDRQSNFDRPRRAFFPETSESTLSQTETNRSTISERRESTSPNNARTVPDTTMTSSSASRRGELRQRLGQNSLDMLIEQQPLRDRRRSRIANRRRHSHGTQHTAELDARPAVGRRTKRSVFAQQEEPLKTPNDQTVKVQSRHRSGKKIESGDTRGITAIDVKNITPVEASRLVDHSENTHPDKTIGQRLSMLKFISRKGNRNDNSRLLRLKARLEQQQQRRRHTNTKKNTKQEDNNGGEMSVLRKEAVGHSDFDKMSLRRKRSISTGQIEQTKDGAMVSDLQSSVLSSFNASANHSIRWRLLTEEISQRIPFIEQRAVLELAFRMWSEVIPVRFIEDTTSDINNVDILIAFAKHEHLECDRTFDGQGGELAHSWAGGDIHFDDDENFKRDDDITESNEEGSVSLMKVAVHEIGHVLGLLHSDHPPSMMYPIYTNLAPTDDLELLRQDRDAVQELYGVCKGSFDAIIDMVKRVPSTTTSSSATTNGDANFRYIYSTYFYRAGHFWMYENSAKRTRYGDPMDLERQWTGLPERLDAVIQVVVPLSSTEGGASGGGVDGARDTDFLIDTYFFKGSECYKYDDTNSRVATGYPKSIASEFGGSISNSPSDQLTATSCNDSLPVDGLDAVFFNSTDDMIYFYKGEWVWLFDSRHIGRTSCPRKVKFTDLYAMSDSNRDPITGSISTVYHSYSFHSTFIVKDELVFEVSAPVSDRSRLTFLSPWYEVWRDICDVD